MISRKVKRFVIAPILILIIIFCSFIIIKEISSGTFLKQYKKITYPSGCEELLLDNGTNLTPLCEHDRALIIIMNYSNNDSNNNIWNMYNIKYPNISVVVNIS